MKNRLVSTIIMATLALQLVACGSANNAAEATAETSTITEPISDTGESTSEEATEEKGTGEAAESSENVGIANPWRDCTEEEAKEACPRLFKLPADDLVSSWRMMEPENSESGVPGNLIELDYRMDGMDFTARAQYGADIDADISGLNYKWDVTEDITLANWGEGNMTGKYSRHIEDGWMVDLCTWYDIEIGIAYSLSVEAEDLEGFDLQAIAEQMYSAENEPLVDMPDDEVEAQADGQADVQSFEGQYYAGRGNLSITAQNDGRYLIEVWWGSSAAEHSEWVMNGEYDESSKTITYNDCVKHDFELGEDGEIIRDDIAYENGTGSIQIVDDNTINWTDDQDHIADDVPMTR
ncbi:hypothetical protein [Butyrivibrio sp. VCD2006]|uniref:hypothetical protein n=1 Tax=Butyrivibrio sp. VCD2006 TaxID=1280664 RepID=UPI00040DDFC2|nr:hypothetical protein [Butyrivibrio sp. VCD2006]